MSFFDALILDIILIIFPVSSILLIKAYTNSVGKIGKNYLIDIANFSSLFLLMQYCDKSFAYTVLLVNMPFVISILYNRKWASILLAFILVGFNTVNGDNIIVGMTEYLIYILIFVLLSHRGKSYKSLLLSFVFIKGIFLTIEDYYILRHNDLIALFKIFICLLVFYLVGILVVKIISKVEETINLNQTLKELEKEKALKNSLFKITHEVKNPIAVCKGYLSMMNPKDEKQINKYKKIVLSEIDRTLDIMDNFSEYTKIKVDLDIMDLDSLITDTIKNMQMLFDKHKIVVNYNYDDEVFINGDYARLKQVLVNILKNSVEAIIEEGVIDINLVMNKKNILLKIKDNGIGLTKEQLEKVGELFYSCKEKGSGIGVTLSKEIMNLHHGEMKYKSVFGEYTEVILKFPVTNNLQ